jgi:membrane-bound lytic murein transglycosylase D
MTDQNTVNTHSPSLRPVRVELQRSGAQKVEYVFSGPFRIGRDPRCDIQVQDVTVSRFHAAVVSIGGRWWVEDLQSGNGVYVDGHRVERAPVENLMRIQLGPAGPVLSFTVEEIPKTPDIDSGLSTEHYVARYFDSSNKEPAGQHTMMIRRAFERVHKAQKRMFVWIISVVSFLFVAAGGYAAYKHRQLGKQQALAQDIFYAMKSFELEQAGFLKAARDSQDPQLLEQLRSYRVKHEKMEQSYQEFVGALDVYHKNLSEEERLILRIARIFGECEINMPNDFVEEVWKYIRKWQSTERLKSAIDRAGKNGYIGYISKTLLAHDLPPQFVYLALQESNLNTNVCGPKTRMGIAKGMWQFIPSTAAYYGLQTGPLVELERFDPKDDRHDFGKSTVAAARYLRDIYDTDAQASGLLVMASYNWGEDRVIQLIRKMPENPKERNFWRLLADHKKQIPRETYDYVFHIISAAVIGENPRLFGFGFDSPLAHIEERVGG